MHSNIDLISQCFQVTNDVMVHQVDDEAILLHPESATYYSLNETSLPCWEALQQQKPLTEVVDALVADYDVEKKQVLRDMQQFLSTLLDLSLISITTP